MYEVLTLNKIAACGLEKLDAEIFSITDEVKNPESRRRHKQYSD